MFRNSVKTVFNFLKIKIKLYNVLELSEFQIYGNLVWKNKKGDTPSGCRLFVLLRCLFIIFSGYMLLHFYLFVYPNERPLYSRNEDEHRGEFLNKHFLHRFES